MTSMPEVAAEWQNFDQLTADKLYELLRFRHDLCDSKRFLELGCTISRTIYNPFLLAIGRSPRPHPRMLQKQFRKRIRHLAGRSNIGGLSIAHRREGAYRHRRSCSDMRSIMRSKRVANRTASIGQAGERPALRLTAQQLHGESAKV
jgi:hypothetical protein